MKYLIYTICLTAFISCNNKQAENRTPVEEQNETPQVLENEKSYDWASSSKERYTDIISKLFAEALEKNAELKKLNDAITNIPKTAYDSAAVYKKYAQLNTNYWNATENYISRLKDSTLKESTREIFKTLQENYKKKISLHESKLKTISKKAISLNDQFILMQLTVTQTMMQNYQVNELPSKESLEIIIDEYNKLIKESKEMKSF